MYFKIDIVIPVYHSYDKFKNLIKELRRQKNVIVENIVVTFTVEEKDSLDDVVKYCKNENIIYSFVKLEDFSHSFVREQAIKKYAKNNIVVLLTQDIKLLDDSSLYNLVKDINGEIVYTFGRQICRKKCIEKYIREYNYPSTSYIVDKSDVKSKQIKSFFASDVFAGINRNVFIKLGGYQGLKLPTNEDMFYMHSLLMNGYKAKYCADASVEHYHSLPAKKLYKRYYNAGKFFKIVKVFDKYDKSSSGKKLAFYILKEAIKHFDIITIIRWPFNMAIRYIGMKRGEKAKI